MAKKLSFHVHPVILHTELGLPDTATITGLGVVEEGGTTKLYVEVVETALGDLPGSAAAHAEPEHTNPTISEPGARPQRRWFWGGYEESKADFLARTVEQA